MSDETSVLEIRDVPPEALEILRARAERRSLSLAAYLRELILDEASLPGLDDVMARLAEDEPIAYTEEDLRDFRAADHR
ncbi:hypothetical protein [Nocardiopsis suaedae]|uniref:Antitoxin n=1 Tax=Nocardiopsis suaedae TaxID=3018444 RepID=A0ABT4TM64_9ACTN|nr:hypothetical protein [Nocardiopsis suaedae]MDA2805777.1 hypothetical protein [Nocardiopsis suaedae]